MGLAPCCPLSDADWCRDNIDDPENNKPSSRSSCPYDDAHRKTRQAKFRGKTTVPCDHHLILPISSSRAARTAPEPDTRPPRSRGRPLGRPQLHGFRDPSGARAVGQSHHPVTTPQPHPNTTMSFLFGRARGRANAAELPKQAREHITKLDGAAAIAPPGTTKVNTAMRPGRSPR